MRLYFYGLFFLMLIMNSTVQGQSQFELGGIGGINLTNVIGANASNDNGIRLGVHLGGYGQFEIQDEFGFRLEMHVLSIKGTNSGGFRSIYMDFPLLATYKLSQDFKLLAGVQPSVLLTARVSDGRGVISDDIRTIDLAFIFGGWFQLDEQWGIGLRFVPGISRVGASGAERTFNSNCQLSVGYRFM